MDHHGIGTSDADAKKKIAQEEVKTAMVGAMSDGYGGNYAVFNRPTFKNFYTTSTSYAKRYRELPEEFLSFDPKTVMRLKENRASSMMEFWKQAMKFAMDREKSMLSKIISKDPETNFTHVAKARVTCTIFLDYKWFSSLKKTLGAVTSITRITDTKGQETFFDIPLDLFDVATGVDGGTTSRSNAQHIRRVLDKYFDEDQINFLGGSFDGGILDAQKSGFSKALDKVGLSVLKITSSTCVCHGNAIQMPLALRRIMDDYGFVFEGQNLEQPNPKRYSKDVIWLHENEKIRYFTGIKTLICIMKELQKRSKRREVSFGDFTSFLAWEKEKTIRTNSHHQRWKSHYFQTELEQLPKQCPLRLIRQNDKKLRRTHEKCNRILENLPFLKIAMKHSDYRYNFPEGADIDGNLEAYIGQWVALSNYLWSINDSTSAGYNATTFRSLCIVLKASLEQSDDNVPLSNILLRSVLINNINHYQK